MGKKSLYWVRPLAKLNNLPSFFTRISFQFRSFRTVVAISCIFRIKKMGKLCPKRRYEYFNLFSGETEFSFVCSTFTSRSLKSAAPYFL